MNRYFFLVGLFVVLSIAVSCKKNNESLPSKDSITILYIGDERIFHQDYWGMEATYWIFLPLAAYEGDERGELQPILAESWKHSDDYKTWTFKLRKDIFWHDGVQMTAHDIKFTIDLQNQVNSKEGSIICEIIDDFTFNFFTKKPLLQNILTWSVYYPKHPLENLDPLTYYNWDFWVKPVGNGPYKFVRNVPKTMVEVQANPNYFGKEPKIKKAILKFSQTPSLQELLSGNVDALTYVPRDFLFKIEGDNRFKSYHWWGGWIESIFWNHNNPLFSEGKVRKALTMAINRIELSKVLNYPDKVPIVDVMTTRDQRARRDIPVPIAHDPDNALQLLKESGWIDSNADGILDKNGVDFRFTVGVGEKDNLLATYIQDNFKHIGVQMDIETLESNIIRQRLKKRDFDALIDRFPNHEWNIDVVRGFFGESNYLNYKEKKIDDLFSLIQKTGNKQEIDSIYKLLRPNFQSDIPITFLLPQVQTHIVSSKVKGLYNLYKADPVWFLESLWIE